MPAGVVKATSSPNRVVVAPRSATLNSAASTGAAASTHAIASAIGASPRGAAAAGVVEVAADVAVDDGDSAAGRDVDGVIGVSRVAPDRLSGPTEQPPSSRAPTSGAVANSTAIRIRPG